MPYGHVAHTYVVAQTDKFDEVAFGCDTAPSRIVAGIGFMSLKVSTSVSEPVRSQLSAGVLAAFNDIYELTHCADSFGWEAVVRCRILDDHQVRY